MIIFGTGIDIVPIKKIRKIYHAHREKFINKILSAKEIKIIENLIDDTMKISYLAKRFTAKEAISKALKHGIRYPLYFTSIIILNDSKGAPFVQIEQNITEQIVNNDKCYIDISITDTEELAMSYALCYIE